MTTLAQTHSSPQHAGLARIAHAAALLKRDLVGVFRFWVEVSQEVAELRREVNRSSRTGRVMRADD